MSQHFDELAAMLDPWQWAALEKRIGVDLATGPDRTVVTMTKCDHKFLGSNHCAKCGWPVAAIEAVDSLRTALTHAIGQVIELTAEVTQLRARQSTELVMTDADKPKQAAEFHWKATRDTKGEQSMEKMSEEQGNAEREREKTAYGKTVQGFIDAPNVIPSEEALLRKEIAPRVEQPDFLMQFFAWEHLPARLQAVSALFGVLAGALVEQLPRNPERTVALRKLLEAKDCAVRCALAK